MGRGRHIQPTKWYYAGYEPKSTTGVTMKVIKVMMDEAKVCTIMTSMRFFMAKVFGVENM